MTNPPPNASAVIRRGDQWIALDQSGVWTGSNSTVSRIANSLTAGMNAVPSEAARRAHAHLGGVVDVYTADGEHIEHYATQMSLFDEADHPRDRGKFTTKGNARAAEPKAKKPRKQAAPRNKPNVIGGFAGEADPTPTPQPPAESLTGPEAKVRKRDDDGRVASTQAVGEGSLTDAVNFMDKNRKGSTNRKPEHADPERPTEEQTQRHHREMQDLLATFHPLKAGVRAEPTEENIEDSIKGENVPKQQKSRGRDGDRLASSANSQEREDNSRQKQYEKDLAHHQKNRRPLGHKRNDTALNLLGASQGSPAELQELGKAIGIPPRALAKVKKASHLSDAITRYSDWLADNDKWTPENDPQETIRGLVEQHTGKKLKDHPLTTYGEHVPRPELPKLSKQADHYATFTEAIDHYRAKPTTGQGQLEFDWKTINGTHVLMNKQGEVVGGPDRLKKATAKTKTKPKPGSKFAEAVKKYKEDPKGKAVTPERKKFFQVFGSRPTMTDEENKIDDAIQQRHRDEEITWQEADKLRHEAKADYRKRVADHEKAEVDKHRDQFKEEQPDLKGKEIWEMNSDEYTRAKVFTQEKQRLRDLKSFGMLFKDYEGSRDQNDYEMMNHYAKEIENKRGWKAMKNRYRQYDGTMGDFYSVKNAMLMDRAKSDEISYDDLREWSNYEEHKAAVKEAIESGIKVPSSVFEQYRYDNIDWPEDYDRPYKIEENVASENRKRESNEWRAQAREGRKHTIVADKAQDATRAAFGEELKKINEEARNITKPSWEATYAQIRKAEMIEESTGKIVAEASKDVATAKAKERMDKKREQYDKKEIDHSEYWAARTTYYDKLKNFGKDHPLTIEERKKEHTLRVKDQENRKKAETLRTDKIAAHLANLAGDRSANPTPIKIDIPKDIDSAMQEKIKKAQDWLNKFVHPSMTADIKINYKHTSGRASCGYNDTLNLFHNDDISTIVHEIGHAIEHANDDRIGKRSKEFMHAQVQNHDAEHFGGSYETYEVGSKDGFLHQYSGKSYSPPGSTEILSMGLQALYDGTQDFVGESKKHANYTLASILGDFEK